MASPARLIIFLLLALPAAVQGSEYMLFSPAPLEGELLLPEKGKGVLVRRVNIKPGDTLGKISREASGRASYFPQILLFNDIRNPDLIRAGKDLLVPVSRLDAPVKSDAAEKKSSAQPARKAAPAKAKAKTARSAVPAEKSRRKSAGVEAKKKTLPSDQLKSIAEQDSYELAITAYRKKDYNYALSLFNRFLELYPTSALAADASFYKAECLLKLSGQ